MSNILVHGLSPEIEASLQAFSSRSGLTLSQAALKLIEQGLESEPADSEQTAGVPVGDYLAETLKEALHTKDEAEEFIRSHE
jgi:hypothetical protein